MADLVVYSPLAHESLSAAIGAPIVLTPAKYKSVVAGSITRPRNAKFALITVEGAQIRWSTVAGAAAAAGTGHLANIGDALQLEGYDAIANFSAIGIGGTATLKITYSGV
jgi:hypothetical protein